MDNFCPCFTYFPYLQYSPAAQSLSFKHPCSLWPHSLYLDNRVITNTVGENINGTMAELCTLQYEDVIWLYLLIFSNTKFSILPKCLSSFNGLFELHDTKNWIRHHQYLFRRL